MHYEIVGEVMQRLEITLQAGESIYTEAGGVSWLVGDIKMDTSDKGGIIKGLLRVATGEPFFVNTYTCQSGEAHIVLTTDYIGKILAFKLELGQSVICQKDSFLCAQVSVDLGIHVRHHLGAGLLGGEGFILQRVTGPGWFFAEIAGEVTEHRLADGETMKVNPGFLALHEPSVECNVAVIRGLKNLLFSGEGVFWATLTGPGQVWLQTMPVANLAARLRPYILPKGEEE